MNPDECPRCGLPENWTLRVRLQLVGTTVLVLAVVGFVLGFITGRRGAA